MTRSKSPLEELVICTIKCDRTKMTLKISQPHLIAKMTQLFNNDVKSLMTFNTQGTPHKGIVNAEKGGKQSKQDDPQDFSTSSNRKNDSTI